MAIDSKHYRGVAAHHDRLAEHGVYGLLAPQNRGGGKSEYVTAVFNEALLPYLRERRISTLLDFGCGTGTFISQAAALVEKAMGVDISAGAIEVARQLCTGLPNVELKLTDGDRLPFVDASFDCAVAREVLMYVPEEKLAGVFAEVRRVLKPGGRFFVLDQVSNEAYWQRHPTTPLQLKRAPAGFRECAAQTGFALLDEYAVRTPRFPGVYLAWSGLVPHALIPILARIELAWHRRWPQPRRRWWNDLFIFAKPT